MELCGSRRKLGMFVLYLVYLSGYFNMMAVADVCSCQQYSCPICPSAGFCSKTNVALEKTANASSLYNNTGNNQVSGPACLAVNGNTGTEFKPINTNPDNPACVHTADGDPAPYWEVDLGQQHIISSITVYGRQENGWNTLRKATVKVDNELCFTFPSDYLQNTKLDISCNPPLTGRKVKIQKNNTIDLPFLAVCQVQVWGCNSGFYGSDCINTCGNCSAGTCEPSSGVCPQGCVAGYQEPYCKDTCTNNTYGLGCNETCGNCAGNPKCNVYNGSCETGCAAGYRPPLCKDVCIGSYGLNCRYPCGNCTDGTTCDATSGECPHGCKAGYRENYCNETCKNNTFGSGCNEMCGHCANDSQCNNYDGRCEAGCGAGYTPPLCTAACIPGTYGKDCNKTCGNCSDPSACNIYNGTCRLICAAGYSPPLCLQVCSNKTYGKNCKFTCGQCGSSGICDIYDGTCDTCVSNFELPYCNVCSTGFYGPDCTKTCGNCSEVTSCDGTSGVCPHGCKKGFQGVYCNETCSNKTYGENCKFKCGHCGGSGICDMYNGTCDTCVLNFKLPYCNELAGLPGPEERTPVIAGVTVACVVLVIIVLVVTSILLLRRRRAKNSQQGANNMAFPHAGRGGRQLKAASPELSLTSMSSLTKFSGGEKGKADKEKLRKAVTPTVVTIPKGGAAGAEGVTSENIYANLAQDVSPGGHPNDVHIFADILPELEDESDHTYRNDENTYATFLESRPQLDSVQQSLIDLLGSEKLPGQFQELPKGLTDVCETAKLPDNIKKNRYYSVLPYDKNLVVLSDGFSEGMSTDFINASYITGFHQAKKYIATQAPRVNTVNDFWRMVWQEQITQIVMLTGLVENGKNKCFEYWPARNKTENYGPVTVTGLDVQRKAHFFVRTFIISMCGSGEEREVEQLNFVTWPDHGVPTTTSLLNFWRFAKARAPHRPPPPVLVHCTAGVGRTGTYIGLDIAYEQAVSQGNVNVFEIVDRMRTDRCIMVQAPDQYIFLHKALLEAYTAEETTIANDRFDKVFPEPITARKGNPRIDREFKRAMQMRSLTPAMPVTTATEESNNTKIRNTAFLPADEHLVYLTAHVPGRSQFINAVYMPTYRQNNGSILTQLPLEETLVDFWRLVDGCDVNTIVSLGHEDEQKTVQDYCQFWPKDSTSLAVDPYIIKHKVTSSLGSQLTSYTLSVEEKKVPGFRQVQLLHYEAWAGELPENTTDLLALIDKIDSLCLGENNPPPVIIQCQDGVTRSGLLAALWNVLSRLTSDKEVDVYMAVREVHSVRPQAVTSLEQYRYCYEMAQKRVSELNIYSNA